MANNYFNYYYQRDLYYYQYLLSIIIWGGTVC